MTALERLRGKRQGRDRHPGVEETPARGGRWTPHFLLLGLLLLTVAFVALLNYGYSAPSPGEELSLDEVYRLADENRIHSVELLDEDSQLVGKTCLVPPPDSEANGSEPAVEGQPLSALPPPPRCSGPVTDFHAAYPGSDVATQQLIDVLTTTTGAKVVVDKQTDVAVVRLLATYILPLLLLANLFGLISMWPGAGSMLADVAELATSRRKRPRRQQAGREVTFDDVAGADEAVSDLREVMDYLRDPKSFEAYHLPPPKGVVLFGPPGCGKTLLARAVAGEASLPLLWVSARQLVESPMGVGAARVSDLFRQVRDEAPAVVFIDEIDVVASRGTGEAASRAERERTLNQLLVEMDALEVTAGIVVIVATSRPDLVDPALLLPGRFDRHVTLEPPDVSAREAILKVHARNRPIAEDADFKLVAQVTPGFTGADLANVINEGAWLAGRESRTISSSHLLEAIQRVLQGPSRRGRLITAEERRRLAVHQAGHAVVAAALGRNEELRRVSIMARGLGVPRSGVSPDGDRMTMSAKEMQEELALAMAGIAAEQLVFSEASTTGRDDIAKASVLARQMVGLYGMSPTVGRLRLLIHENGYVRSGEFATEDVSGQTREQFDREVKGLIAEAERSANMVLLGHRADLDEMASILEREETLEGVALEARLAQVRYGRYASASASQREQPAHEYRLWGGASEPTTEPQRNDAGGWSDARG